MPKLRKDWWSVCDNVMSNIVSNIAIVETGFYERGKRLEERTINGWFYKVAESKSLITIFME